VSATELEIVCIDAVKGAYRQASLRLLPYDGIVAQDLPDG
jgi:hypothetical protein